MANTLGVLLGHMCIIRWEINLKKNPRPWNTGKICELQLSGNIYDAL